MIEQQRREMKANRLRRFGGKGAGLVLPESPFVALEKRATVFHYNQYCKSQSKGVTCPNKADI